MKPSSDTKLHLAALSLALIVGITVGRYSVHPSFHTYVRPNGWSIFGAKLNQSTGAPAAPAGPATCPPIDPAEVPEQCAAFDHVCIDQGVLILHNDSYGLTGPLRDALPRFAPGRRYLFPWRTPAEVIPDTYLPCDSSTYTTEYPEPVFRPKSAVEPSPDLRDPVTFSCTVPLLYYLDWMYNFSHTFGNGVSWIFSLLRLRRPSYAGRVQLVVPTPHGLGMKPFTKLFLQPLSNGPVQTLADFSNRPPTEPAAATSPDAAAPRCFAAVLLCRGLLGISKSSNIWQAGQFYAAHYRGAVPTPDIPFRSAPAPLPPEQQRQLAARTPGSSSGGSGSSSSSGISGSGSSSHLGSNGSGSSGGGPSPAVARRLSVIFQARGGNTRQLLNQGELVEACSRWHHYSAGLGVDYTAECAAWSMGDIPAAVAVAQRADVFIGVHGANIPNAWFMRPGSSVIEVFLPDFIRPMHEDWNREDRTSELLYWSLHIQDPGAVQQGESEASGTGCPKKYPRDRNFSLRWEALELILGRLADVGGNMTAYRQLRKAGGVHFRMRPEGTEVFKYVPGPGAQD